MFKLLTRDQFREAVFARDGHVCLACKKPGKDAHHIMERRLWPDGGYYLENGATVCEVCHVKAEETILGTDDLRELAQITKYPLPPHLYRDQMYDKWGNPILPNGKRLKGELFEDTQKILGPVLHLFVSKVKYPRTYHLPWSPGVTKDDRVMQDLKTLEGSNVVVTVKMDGENTTMYSDYVHVLEENPFCANCLHKRIKEALAHPIPHGLDPSTVQPSTDTPEAQTQTTPKMITGPSS